MMQKAPTSSSSTCPPTYDVFLNFRGGDVRTGFANNLKEALRRRGIHPFFDEEGLKTGDVINPTLVEAIRNSRMAITIFSPKYLESNACLMELAEISNHMSKRSFILPIFYNIEPKMLRDGSDAVQMEEKWRSALKSTTRIKGWSFRTDGEVSEYKFIEEIVENVSTKLVQSLSTVDYQVGLKSRVEYVCSLLNVVFDGVNMVGICGMAGIGKTTLARAVYDSISNEFSHKCFLSKVRENSMKRGLVELQKTLLSSIFGENMIRVENTTHGSRILEQRLKTNKVLLVLDDVDALEQLQALAGRNWFHPGSKVIITTKDLHLLKYPEVKKIYKVEELNNHDACELLSLHACGKREVEAEYKSVLNQAVNFARGHPLILEALGSNLHGLTVEDWKSALKMYAKCRSEMRWSDKDIQKTLKVSYNGLTEVEQDIFLDIACFYKGERLEYVRERLQSSHDFDPADCIRVLINKFLIKINEQGVLDMHDLYEEMGKKIVQQSKSEPGERSRLWCFEDINHVLENNTGTSELQVIKLKYGDKKKIKWSQEAFRKMRNLRELCITLSSASFSTKPKCLPNSLRVLQWHKYPSSSLPSDFDPSNIVMLDLHDSDIELNKPFERFKSLCNLSLDNCRLLTQVPDLSSAELLTTLNLDYCYSLTKIHDSVGSLPKLHVLTAQYCYNLKILPRVFKLPSLQILNLMDCQELEYFPEISMRMEKIKMVRLSGSGIVELPESMENLIGLESLFLENCQKLYRIPIRSIAKLTRLNTLVAKSCGALNWRKVQQEERSTEYPKCQVTKLMLGWNEYVSDEVLPTLVRWFCNLRVLELQYNKFTVLPESMEECHCLMLLNVDCCYQLQEIKGIPPNIKKFSAMDCVLLNSRSSKPLLSQNIHEARNTHFVLPGKEIPEWFQHRNNSNSVSFWFREKIPDIAVCIVLQVIEPIVFLFKFQLLVNGTLNLDCFQDAHWLRLKRDHIYLLDITSQIQKVKLQLMEHPKGKWNHVQILCDQGSESVIKYTGVYVYNYESYKEGIRFKNPIPSERTLDCESSAKTSEICDDNCRSNDPNESQEEPSVTRIHEKEQKLKKGRRGDINHSLASTSPALRRKKRRKNQEDSTLKNSISITDSQQQQRCLSSVTHQISECNTSVGEAKGVEIIVYDESGYRVKGSQLQVKGEYIKGHKSLQLIGEPTFGMDNVWINTYTVPKDQSHNISGKGDNTVVSHSSNNISDKGDDAVISGSSLATSLFILILILGCRVYGIL